MGAKTGAQGQQAKSLLVEPRNKLISMQRDGNQFPMRVSHHEAAKGGRVERSKKDSSGQL